MARARHPDPDGAPRTRRRQARHLRRRAAAPALYWLLAVVEKTLGLAVVLLILVCAWRLARISLPRCWRGLLRGANWAWLVATGAALIAIAKAMDGLDRKLAPWGIAVDPVTAMRAGRIEEVLELVAYIMLAQAGVYVAQMVEVPQTMPHVSPTWRPR